MPELTINPDEIAAALRRHVEALGAARKKSRALREGDRSTLLVENDLWIQQRLLGSDGAVVVIHRGTAARTVSVSARGPKLRYRDVLSGVEVELGNGAAATLNVPAGASMVLVAP